MSDISVASSRTLFSMKLPYPAPGDSVSVHNRFTHSGRAFAGTGGSVKQPTCLQGAFRSGFRRL